MAFHIFKIGDKVEAAFASNGKPCWNGVHLQSQRIHKWMHGSVILDNYSSGLHKDMILVRFDDGSAAGLQWLWESPTKVVAGAPLGIQPGYLRPKSGASNIFPDKQERLMGALGQAVAACQKKAPLNIQKIVERGKWSSAVAMQQRAKEVETETHGEIRRSLREWPWCPNGGTVNVEMTQKTETQQGDGISHTVPAFLWFEWSCSCCPSV